MTEARVSPDLLPGFEDIPPAKMIQKQEMLSKVRRVFELFGFEPLDTAIVQFRDVLFGFDEETEMEFFSIANSRSKSHRASVITNPNQRRPALRFDLTVPLARYIAANISTLPRPFLRYQEGKVFRGEKPREGRFCEFTQCDIDIIFAPDLWADAQIMVVMYETLQALGIRNFRIMFNNRKFCDGLPVFAGFEQSKLIAVLQALDKQDKIGLDGVIEELRLLLGSEQVARLKEILSLTGSNKEKLSQAQNLVGESEIAVQGLREMSSILGYCKSMGVPEDFIQVAFQVVRGLGYYTGPVFETVLLDYPELGSVFSGGRFDGLVSRFAEINAPAVGAGLGVDRLLAGMNRLNLFPSNRSVVQVLITVMDKSYLQKYLDFATRLRRTGFNVLVYTGGDSRMRTQLTRAVKENIPLVVIAGSDEINSASVTIKDIRSGQQVKLPEIDLESAVQTLLTK